MTSDDQQFLDLLASIPQDVAHYGGRLADYIEKHTNSIASDIRDAIDSASWLPESLKPPRSVNTHHFFTRPPPPPQGIYEKTVDFVSKNRTTIAVVVAFAGTTAYLIHRRKKAHSRKRRAKKLPNGAKKEIVVLACSTFHDPLTKSLAVDLERRGYVVYVTVSSTEEDSLVQQEAKADLRPLWMDLTSTVPNPTVDIHPDLEPIRELLTKTSRPSSPRSSSRRSHSNQGSAMSNMTLAGVIVFPGCSGYPVGPLALLHPSDVVDSVNTRLLSPILIVQQFLPLLVRHSTDAHTPASIVIAYPSIPSSLSPPSEIPSTVISSSLSALASSLRRETVISKSYITVSELKLGNFDLGSVYSKNNQNQNSNLTASPLNALAVNSSPHWHSSQRAAFHRSRMGQPSLLRTGSSAREFHNAVFDALAPPQSFKAFGRLDWSLRKRETVFVGSGARLYNVLGKYMPTGIVAFMMGYHKSASFDVETGATVNGSQPASGSGTPAPFSAGSAVNASSIWGAGSIGGDSAVWEKL